MSGEESIQVFLIYRPVYMASEDYRKKTLVITALHTRTLIIINSLTSISNEIELLNILVSMVN